MKRIETFQLRTSDDRGCLGSRSTERACWTLGLLLSVAGCTSSADSSASVSTNAGTASATPVGGASASSAGNSAVPANTTGQGLSPGESEYPAAVGETAAIMTLAGPVVGDVVDHKGTPVNIFRGIPYAAPAAGNLRFAPPAPVAPWTEALKAKPWANRCPQVESRLTANGAISEDCLNLNVVTPSLERAAGLPVMVFYHGGGLTIGTANSPTYSHFALPAQENVVVVTVNQRLGPIGYLAHPALAAESANASSGNYGTLDQIASLEWVRDNIAAFGGDANNVTIFGESGGGTKVLSCVGSPRCKGLFHRAIVQSGSGSNGQSAMTDRATAEQQGVALAAKLGITADDPNALQKLRAAPFEDIVAAAEDTAVGFRTNITIDGWVFPKSIYDALQEGSQSDVPLIVGANEAESTLLSGSVPDLAIGMASVPSKAYVYNFTRLPPGWQVDSCPGAFHGLELAYVFGHVPWALTSPTMVFLGLQAGCPTMTDPAATDVDQQIAVNAMKIWGQFARTGNPSVAGLIEWPPYTAEGDQYLELGEQLTIKTGVRTSGVAASGIGGSM
jgi:para-nitrobenzyl esterase